jgi:hypothetical protein
VFNDTLARRNAKGLFSLFVYNGDPWLAGSEAGETVTGVLRE